MSNKKTAHTEAELIAIFKEDNIDEQYFEKFIAYYKIRFADLYEDHKNMEDDEWVEGDSVQASALWSTNEYIKPYIQLRKIGHGEEWAHSIAHSLENVEMAVYYTHSELKKINPELAERELLNHTISLDSDPYFQKHYIYLFEILEDPERRIEIAKDYSKLYKEEIAKGKTEIYAHHYANLMSDGEDSETYCKEYAFAFDQAIKENKTEDYARVYADRYASAFVDIEMRYFNSDLEEMIEFANEKVEGYMKAWEYGKQNQLKDFDRFAELYENIHLNTYFAYAGKPDLPDDEIDAIILKKTLERFNK